MLDLEIFPPESPLGYKSSRFRTFRNRNSHLYLPGAPNFTRFLVQRYGEDMSVEGPFVSYPQEHDGSTPFWRLYFKGEMIGHYSLDFPEKGRNIAFSRKYFTGRLPGLLNSHLAEYNREMSRDENIPEDTFCLRFGISRISGQFDCLHCIKGKTLFVRADGNKQIPFP